VLQTGLCVQSAVQQQSCPRLGVGQLSFCSSKYHFLMHMLFAGKLEVAQGVLVLLLLM